MKKFIPILFIVGVLILILNIAIRIMHLPVGRGIYQLGAFVLDVSFMLALVEIFSSKRGTTGFKVLWSLPLIFLLVYVGASASMAIVNWSVGSNVIALISLFSVVLYFVVGRRKFVKQKDDPRNIEFDSIDVKTPE